MAVPVVVLILMPRGAMTHPQQGGLVDQPYYDNKGGSAPGRTQHPQGFAVSPANGSVAGAQRFP